jgi:hypothetical protein
VWDVTSPRRPTPAVEFFKTGAGAKGLYVSRDAKNLYVSDRAAGEISVVSFAASAIVAT